MTTTTPRLDEAKVRGRLELLRDRSDDPSVVKWAAETLGHTGWDDRETLRRVLLLARDGVTVDGRSVPLTGRSPFPAVRAVAAGVLYDLTHGKLDAEEGR